MLPTAKVRSCLEITKLFFLFYHKAKNIGGILLTSGLDTQSNTDYTLWCFVLLGNHSVYTASVNMNNQNTTISDFFSADFISLYKIHFSCLIFV